MRVHRPGETGVAARTELVAGGEDDIGHVGQRRDRAAVEQIAGHRLDAGGVELLAHRGVAEAGDADDAPRRRRPLGQASERRPHLAGDAEDHQVALDRRQLVDQRLARQRQEVVERLARGEALWQGRRVEDGHVMGTRSAGQFSGVARRFTPPAR